MKKKLWISVLILGVAIAVFYSIVKFNPPLEIGTIASSGDRKSVVVGIGNKGLREIKVLDTSVNNNEAPLKTKVQVTNALQGFIISNDYNNEESKEYGFKSLEDVSIKEGTSPSSNFKKLDAGTASKEDEIYGISVIHHEAINKVHLRYRYLGISFNETVFIN